MGHNALLIGDPTKGALIAAAPQMGYGKSSIEAIFPRTAELPFDFDRKHMTTDHHRRGYNSKTLAGLAVGDKPYITFTKGSVDGLLTLSTHNWVNGNVEIMNEQ